MTKENAKKLLDGKSAEEKFQIKKMACEQPESIDKKLLKPDADLTPGVYRSYRDKSHVKPLEN